MGRVGKGRKKGAPGTTATKSEPHTKNLKQDAPSAPKGTYGQGLSSSDIEFMRSSIQALCQSTNPLGKSIDFVTEDIDSMTKEFEFWKHEYVKC